MPGWRVPKLGHAARDRRLSVLIRASHEASRSVSKSPRVQEDLRAQRLAISGTRIARLMREEGLRAHIRRRFRATTLSDPAEPVAANVLARRFAAAVPINAKSAARRNSGSGAARSPTWRQSGSLFEFAVGWAARAVYHPHVAARAGHGVEATRPQAGLPHHSDQGCTYASDDDRTRLARHGIACSLSRQGNCYDNAVRESWFSTPVGIVYLAIHRGRDYSL